MRILNLIFSLQETSGVLFMFFIIFSVIPLGTGEIWKQTFINKNVHEHALKFSTIPVEDLKILENHCFFLKSY